MTSSISLTRLNYLDYLETELTLPPPGNSQALVIDLFAGCGGFALGFEAAGFQTIGYERSAEACQTYRHNLNRPCHQITLTPETELQSGATVIIGGPPCQPFSVSGHQKGLKDSRDGFPIFLNAVRRDRPNIAIFENVRGMLYRNKTYFQEIVQTLKQLDYQVEYQVLTASDYGVPQRRQRLFCIAHRGGWQWPSKSHDRHPYTAGEALGNLTLTIPKNAKFLTSSMDRYIEKYERASNCVRPRDLHLDRPARTVTCRNLGAATGDMLRIRLPDGRRRRLTVREGARLQSFPDWFRFQGSEENQYNQIGNAVPPLFAKRLATEVKNYLNLCFYNNLA
ncbi:DNA cytosine methyltransferase [Oxynema sp. CENA135]|uniref:DNA cytosine methyltransferase n=1 Tax=Oxynema sp. CENA135 TaxID=984206 RepID=UPI00190B4466|nr:DNA cytosine methyltransferase [Oxynema sp. CENA135]MBK4730966.1 DNA cytosine methyltransferase [Oxynema sp. CENA135]